MNTFVSGKTCCFALLIVSSAFLSASSIAPVKIQDLYQQADVVAAVRVVSGTSEGYEPTVYKAEVTRAFKGCKKHDSIYIGPFNSLGIGSDYLVFLRKSGSISPKQPTGINYGTVPTFYQIMYAGFGSLNLEYACVFDGRDIKDHCRYAVKFNPAQIIVPSNVPLFPKGDANVITNLRKVGGQNRNVQFAGRNQLQVGPLSNPLASSLVLCHN